MKLPNRAPLVVLLVALVALSPAAAFLWRHVVTPSDGARLAPGQSVWRSEGVAVSVLENRPGGLQSGDVVVAVEGRSIEAWVRLMLDPGAARPRWQEGQGVTYTVRRDGRLQTLSPPLGTYPWQTALARDWSTILFALAAEVVAGYVFLRRPGDAAARLLFLWASCILSATTWSLGLRVSDLVDGIGLLLFLLSSHVVFVLFWIAGVHFALVFPVRSPLIAARPRALLWIYAAPYAIYAAYLAAVWPASGSNVLVWLGRWGTVEAVIAAIYSALLLAASVHSYRASPGRAARQKIRWVLFAALLSGGGGLVVNILPTIVLGHSLISPGVLGLLLLPFPLAIAVAIMRHHLFEIETLLNRAMVYGALTAGTMGIYVLLVGYLGDLLQARDRSVIAFLTTGLVAVLFQPMRERLQRAVNRLMYGERDDPYAVLSRLGQQLESTLAPDSVLPTIVETVAQTLKLPYAAISFEDADSQTIAAAYGLPQADTLALPLRYQHDLIGHLLVAPRSSDEPFIPAERRLLEDIARRAEVAVHNVRLTAELQHSRERLVTAREEERRRLRRDLHDGLGPALAAQTLKVGAARALAARDPAAADALLAGLERDIDSSLADIRRLVYNLRPPALDELGLVGAIRESITRLSQEGGSENRPLHISLDAPELLPLLPAAVEVAVYRITQEALANAVRYSQGRACMVRLKVAESLQAMQLEIIDDGTGLPAERHAGVGLSSMRERAEELGGTCAIENRPEGGTRVVARLPINY
ncbi:MAG: hypothetical protein HY872_00330 [Chloroflexi bacterium]|nr:hypothetical protein [Chloroflexota bacterium]